MKAGVCESGEKAKAKRGDKAPASRLSEIVAKASPFIDHLIYWAMTADVALQCDEVAQSR